MPFLVKPIIDPYQRYFWVFCYYPINIKGLASLTIFAFERGQKKDLVS